jgi:hypothetical protein
MLRIFCVLMMNEKRWMNIYSDEWKKLLVIKILYTQIFWSQLKWKVELWIAKIEGIEISSQ